jgi:hypothetical protein
LQIKLANLIGTNTKVSSVDSVSELIKDSNNLNDKTINAASGVEELVVEENKPRSIKINKKNEES